MGKALQAYISEEGKSVGPKGPNSKTVSAVHQLW